MRYEKYKDSGIEWIGEIPEHWGITTVGRLSNLGRGRVISAIEIAENKGEYPVYSSQTENNGIMGNLNTYDFEGEYVTWTTDGAYAGTVFYREGKFNCTNVCGTIQPKNWDQIYLRFLPYFLNLGTKFSVRLDINPKLMNNMMAKIPLAIPPLKEQTTIANYLDRKTAEIDELIADKKRLLELYEEEKTAITNQAVTKGINPNVPMKDSGIEWLGEIPEHWEVSRIKSICKVRQGLQIPIEKRLLTKEEGALEYITIRSINNPDDAKQYILNPAENVICTKDDILMARTGATGIPIIEVEGVFHNNFFLIDFDREKVEKMFLYYFLKSSKIKEYLLLVAGTTTIPDLNHGAFYSTPFFAFEKDEQNEIIEFIENECDKINTKITRISKLIDLLTEYRTALISEVVTGKVKVI